jgi:hypothetical protein
MSTHINPNYNPKPENFFKRTYDQIINFIDRKISEIKSKIFQSTHTNEAQAPSPPLSNRKIEPLPVSISVPSVQEREAAQTSYHRLEAALDTK